jgi:hypothetical protein
MRSRFKKVWCASCGTMQFAGECGHGRVEMPAAATIADVRAKAEGSPWRFFYTTLMRIVDGALSVETKEDRRR